MLQTHPSTHSIVQHLNDLIETAKDGQKGFQAAAEDSKESKLKELFFEFSRQRAGFVGELQSIVATQGHKPEESGSIAGAVHRGWINLKAAVSPREHLAILEECERGEEHATDQYQQALAHEELGSARTVVQRQAEQVARVCEQIKSLRAQYSHSRED